MSLFYAVVASFSYQRLQLLFLRSLSDSKSAKVSSILQSILAYLNNTVV